MRMMSTPSRSAGRPLSRFIRRSLVLSTLAGLTLLAAGCGGRGQSGAGMEAPGEDAAPSEIARYVEGNWTVTLNQGEPTELSLPLQLSVGDVEAGTADVEGTLAGSSLTDAALAFGADVPALRFTTGEMTVEGVAGPIEVPGPTTWNGTLRQGRITGTVEGPDGSNTGWTATRGN